MKHAAFAIVMTSVLCGCAQHDRLVLSSGERVESLYYHECRMPDEIMTEMWIDFPARRLRVKCGLHDALGWTSSRCDSVRIDVRLDGSEWRSVVRKLRLADLETWPSVRSPGGDVGSSSWYLRMASGERDVERFSRRTMPRGGERMREIVGELLSRGERFAVRGGGVVPL